MASNVPFRRAVGLEYRPESDDAPCVTIQGDADEAEEIIRLARRFGVPVIEEKHLARTLAALPLGATIPASLYRAVAVILQFLDQRLMKQR